MFLYFFTPFWTYIDFDFFILAICCKRIMSIGLLMIAINLNAPLVSTKTANFLQAYNLRPCNDYIVIGYVIV